MSRIKRTFFGGPNYPFWPMRQTSPKCSHSPCMIIRRYQNHTVAARFGECAGNRFDFIRGIFVFAFDKTYCPTGNTKPFKDLPVVHIFGRRRHSKSNQGFVVRGETAFSKPYFLCPPRFV